MPEYKIRAATFYGWLMRQRQRDDPVGDLARDAKLDSTFPRAAQTHNGVLRHLEEYGASYPAQEAFERAWKEWEGYRDGNGPN